VVATTKALIKIDADVMCALPALWGICANRTPEIVNVRLEPAVNAGRQEGSSIEANCQLFQIWLSCFLQKVTIVSAVRRPEEGLPGLRCRSAVDDLIRAFLDEFVALRFGQLWPELPKLLAQRSNVRFVRLLTKSRQGAGGKTLFADEADVASPMERSTIPRKSTPA
jgi:hypothetical protein